MLSGQKIRSESDALRVCLWFHRTYPALQTVIIKSARFDDESASAQPTSTSPSAAASTSSAAASKSKTLHCVATSVVGPATPMPTANASSTGDSKTADSKSAASAASSSTSAAAALPTHFYHMTIPVLDGYFSGTGDLTSALLLSWLDTLKNDLPRAIELTYDLCCPCVWLWLGSC